MKRDNTLCPKSELKNGCHRWQRDPHLTNAAVVFEICKDCRALRYAFAPRIDSAERGFFSAADDIWMYVVSEQYDGQP